MEKGSITEGKVKGILFLYLRDYIVERQNLSTWEALIDELDPLDVSLMRGIVLANSWYPVRIWNKIINSHMSSFPSPSLAMSQFCEYLGEKELTSIVKIMLSFGSPGFLLKRTHILWNRYFEHGKFGAEEIGPRRWHLWLDGPADENLGAGKLTCSYGPAPWLERGLHLSGATTGKVEHVKCLWDGNPRCEFTAIW